MAITKTIIKTLTKRHPFSSHFSFRFVINMAPKKAGGFQKGELHVSLKTQIMHPGSPSILQLRRRNRHILNHERVVDAAAITPKIAEKYKMNMIDLG